MIMKIQAPDFPWLRFEWHPEERRAYVVRLPGEQADMLVDGVQSPEEMHLVVQAFLAGYRIKANESGTGPRHYRMAADGMRLGMQFK